MANDRDDNGDGTPKNPRLPHDPALAAQGLGRLEMSSDDLLATAAACYSVAKSSHEDLLAGRALEGMGADHIAQLYQIGATWLRVMGSPGLTAQAEKMEALAADVIREAAAADLDRIRKTATNH